MIMKVIDPPEGWRYGFPKAVPEETVIDRNWFIKNGYPLKLVENGLLDYCRIWYEDEDNVED